MAVRILHTASAGFEAARQVDVLPAGHRSRRLHGHSFLAKLRCALPPGWAAFPGGEVERLRDELQARTARLDYRLLNEQLAAAPTDENLARWLRDQLDVPGIEQIGIQSTAHEGVDLDAAGQAHVWRRYVFQAAHRLPNVPAGHQCGRMHGHGFEVIVHANQDLGSRDLAVDYDHLDALWAPLHARAAPWLPERPAGSGQSDQRDAVELAVAAACSRSCPSCRGSPSTRPVRAAPTSTASATGSGRS